MYDIIEVERAQIWLAAKFHVAKHVIADGILYTIKVINSIVIISTLGQHCSEDLLEHSSQQLPAIPYSCPLLRVGEKVGGPQKM